MAIIKELCKEARKLTLTITTPDVDIPPAIATEADTINVINCKNQLT